MIGLVVLGALGIPALIAVASVWNGYALTILWGWFIVTTFGLPPLSLPAAIGLVLVVAYLTAHQSEDAPKDDAGDRLIRSLVMIALRPPIILGIGWIVRQFM